jgi:pimeloyl-ACP methyl ester carboxylesterase
LTVFCRDLAAYLVLEDLTDVILVVHSYSGLIYLGAMPELLPRLAGLICIEAILPDSGQSFAELGGEPFRAMLASRLVDGWLVEPWPAAMFGLAGAPEAEWFMSRVSPFPLSGFTDQPRPAPAAAGKTALYPLHPKPQSHAPRHGQESRGTGVHHAGHRFGPLSASHGPGRLGRPVVRLGRIHDRRGMTLSAKLRKRLPQFTLDVEIVCPAGRILVLTGPSGSGKTTVLRMLAGLEEPDEGRVCLGGHGLAGHGGRRAPAGAQARYRTGLPGIFAFSAHDPGSNVAYATEDSA